MKMPLNHFTAWDQVLASEIVAAHKRIDGPALPILHALQQVFGCVPPDAVRLVAEALNITRAEMHGIVTFYHDFRQTPPGRHVLKLCRAEACQAMGGAGVADAFLSRLGISWGETTGDGGLTVEAVYCLGLCACAPAALLDGEPIGRLDAVSLHEACTA